MKSLLAWCLFFWQPPPTLQKYFLLFTNPSPPTFSCSLHFSINGHSFHNIWHMQVSCDKESKIICGDLTCGVTYQMGPVPKCNISAIYRTTVVIFFYHLTKCSYSCASWSASSQLDIYSHKPVDCTFSEIGLASWTIFRLALWCASAVVVYTKLETFYQLLGKEYFLITLQHIYFNFERYEDCSNGHECKPCGLM